MSQPQVPQTATGGGWRNAFQNAQGQTVYSENTDGSVNLTGIYFPDGSYQSTSAIEALTLSATASFPNLAVSGLHFENMAAGDVVLYTVPAGKRAIVQGSLYNSTVGAITVGGEISIDGGATYQLTNVTFSVGPSGTGQVFSFGIAAEAASKIALNTSALGMTFAGTVWTFDNTSRYKTPYLSNLVTGNNTLYTCPAGKHAMSAGNMAFIAPGINNGGEIATGNQSGNTRTHTIYLVPNGSSASNANILGVRSVGNNLGSGSGNPMNFTLNPGDSIVVNTDTGGGQVSWTNLVEF